MRTRRSACLAGAVLACAVALPSLVVVGAGPVAAANTASELLVDPVDGVTADPVRGVRPFAGDNRYETALMLAERFAHERGGLGSVSVAILVSGERPADGVAVAGLAGRDKAPVLLTRPDRLLVDVGQFINRHDVSEVIVIGGTASVSDRVLREVAALEAEPTVRRISGADRFETAAAVAAELDSRSTWCATDDTVALLTNGSDARLVDAVGIGSLAYARELPILLTRTDELPASAAEYLRRKRTERVVIVGGTSVVSDAVISQLMNAGVDEVERVAARTAAPTAVALAQLMTVTCRFELEPSQRHIALAGPNAVIDAVAAAPVLGGGLDGAGPVPLLMAGNPLPRTLLSFLARTPNEVDDRKNHLHLVAIGGLGVVDTATMSAAVGAADSGRALTARFTASEGAATLQIRFSESLEVDAPRFIARLRDRLFVNGTPAWIAGQPKVSSISADPCGRFSSLSVTLRHTLEIDDVIELRPVADWHSTNGDQREIRGVSYTIPKPRPSFRAPSVEVIAIEGQSKVWIAIRAAEFRELDPAAAEDIVVNPGRIRIVSRDDVTVTVGRPVLEAVRPFLGTALYSFELDATEGGDYVLEVDDLVTVRNGLVTDARDRRSGSSRALVEKVDGQLSIEAVWAGRHNPGVDDSIRTTRPEAIDNVSRRAQASLGDNVRVVAKWTGSAAGAAGNAWNIQSNRADEPVATQGSTTSEGERPATQVWIDATRNLVSIRHVEAPAGQDREQTYGELVEALNGNRDFSRHFVAELRDPCDGADVVVDLDEDETLTGDVNLAGGLSSISFLVSFNDYVREFVSDGQTVVIAGPVGELIDDILGGLIPDYGDPTDVTPGDRVEAAVLHPGKQVFFRFTTADPEHTIGQEIVLRSNRVEVREGIAGGYRDDDGTADIDERVSAGRIFFVVSGRDTLLQTDLPCRVRCS